MKTEITLTERGTRAGLIQPVGSPYRGMSAQQYAKANPAKAKAAAEFIRANKAELVAFIAGRVHDRT